MKPLLCLVLLLLPLSACGKKPTFVDPPVADSAAAADAQMGAQTDTPNTTATGGKAVHRQPGDNYPHLYPKPWL